MKQQHINLFTISALLAIVFYGCTKDFAEINTAKTASTTTSPDGLFTLALQRGSMENYIYQRAQMLHGNHYMQYYANKASYFNTDIYNPNEGWANQIWRRLFSESSFACLHHVTEAASLAQKQDNKHKEAIARIWRAYLFQLTTDMYGDIPYSKAFASNTPEYDKQKDIYYDLFDQLKTAVSYLQIQENYQSFGASDLIFKGDKTKWIRFANSLRLRMALRISNVDQSKTIEVINELASSEFIMSNDDNVKMLWMETSDNHYNLNPLLVINRFNEFRVSKLIIDQLKTNNDPRLAVFAEPAKLDGEYRGMENGYDMIELAGYNENYFDQFSTIGAIFIQPLTPTYSFTYAETCFLLAEASLKGYFSGNPENFYNEGIKASMNMYGINDNTLIDTYIQQSEVKYNTANPIKQIITQKWIALMNNGLESWAERRRTGYPELYPVKFAGGETGGRLPRRLMYASDERLYNYDNLSKAIGSLSEGDNIMSRVWWDNQNN